MRVSLLGKRVETESGRHLGQVRDVVLETESLNLVQIMVRHLWPWATTLPIAVTAIIRIEPEKVIVKENAEAISERLRAQKPVLAPRPAVMAREEME